MQSQNSPSEDVPVMEAVRILLKLVPYGSQIEEKCGDNAFSFIRDLQLKAERYGESFTMSGKQWRWLEKIAFQVLGRKQS